MRAYSVLIPMTMAACTSSSPSYTVPPTTIPDRVNTMSCGATIAEFCASEDCRPTLDIAEHDRSLCEAGFQPVLQVCGDYAIVTRHEIDTGFKLYYRDGNLAAIVDYLVPLDSDCVAGPPSFEAPQCAQATSEPLAACR